jgi:methylmalonyl-CoA/ethylmalonyl-CoA epimerase
MNFHHLGIIVHNISVFESKMIYDQKINEVFDPIQIARLAYYSNFGNTFLELIQPLNSKSPTWNFLQNVNSYGYHHLCYEIDSLIELDEVVKKNRLIPISEPVPAILFEGKDVVFYYTRNKMIVEFIINNNS